MILSYFKRNVWVCSLYRNW